MILEVQNGCFGYPKQLLWEGYPHPQAEGCLEHYLLHSAVPWLRFFLHRSGFPQSDLSTEYGGAAGA